MPGSRQVQSYVFGPFRLVPEEQVLRRGERTLPLPPKAFETLLILVRNPGHLMLKEELIQALWPDTFVEEVNLANKISLLRKVLEESWPAGTCIQTVPKLGYRFLPPVTLVWKSAPQSVSALHAGEAAEERPIRFIALPFAILNGHERIAFLGQSLPEAISVSLAGLRSLTVRSSLLAARLAEGGLDPRRIAREADVDLVLSGSILCDGDRLRVSAELIKAPAATLALRLPGCLGQHFRYPGQPGTPHCGTAFAATDRARIEDSEARRAGIPPGVRILSARHPPGVPTHVREYVDGARSVPPIGR